MRTFQLSPPTAASSNAFRSLRAQLNEARIIRNQQRLESVCKALRSALRRGVAANAGPEANSSAGAAPEGEQLATEFSKFVNAANVQPQYAHPTPMIPPDTAIKSVLEALARNDYPEEDAGVKTAYAFSKPHDCERLLAGQGLPVRARSWEAHERWLTPQHFSEMLHRKPYDVLLGCQEWQVISQLRFPSRRLGNRAIQAVRITPPAGHERAFTFCLERVEVGPYKGCWLVVGVRQGDYATVM